MKVALELAPLVVRDTHQSSARALQFAYRLGGVSVTDVVRMQRPAQLGLNTLSVVCHLPLRPRILDPQHQVTDDRAIEFHDQGDGELVRL